jgi:hypothetical protein
MRTKLMFGLAAAVAGVALVPLTMTRAEDVPDAKAKGETGSVQSSIVRTFARERLLEVKIEHVLESAPVLAGDKKAEGAKPDKALRVGQVIFVDASICSRVLDEKGVEKKRNDEKAWFTKDEGWTILKAGQRVKINYSGVREVPAPTDFPDGARTGGNLLVYTATLIELLPESGIESPVTVESGVVQGAIVRLFAAEKLIELKVEGTKIESAPKGAEVAKNHEPAEGTLILVRLEHATVVDEKGLERKREDKSAWFSKDDGWSLLKVGARIKVEYGSTQQIPAPAEFPKEARAGGTVLVYNATSVHLLADMK